MFGVRFQQLILFLLSFLFISKTYAAYYDILPKNIRILVYRHVMTDSINADYGSDGEVEKYSFNANLDSPSLRSFNSITEEIFSALYELSPEAYQKFTLGEFKLEAKARADISVVGFGYGVTNNVTVYAYLPWFKSNVNMDLVQTKKGNLREIQALLEHAPRNDAQALLTDGINALLEQTSALEPGMINSYLINELGYKPLGDWSAEGPGDLELGAMYKFYERADRGLLLTLGTVLPTGRKDDIDTIQDFGFGDGQIDAFLEFGGGKRLGSKFSVDSWFRYTHQLPFKREIRLPEDDEFYFTDRKGEAEIKLGNKFNYNFQLSYHLKDWITLSPSYSYDYKAKDEYKTPYLESDYVLGKDTEVSAHVARLGLNISTIGLYFAKKFPVPLNFHVSGQTVFAGQNTTKYERVDLEVRMFF